ncbi:MAG: cell filamentation protein Fic [Gammaproteobacteria bacterium]|nr:MAG: cell filamentation protein Fic [Gammaproteobacteria bacterium]PIE37705.1 MAG: cell filamentation protein Fic [Gammaproteobacteria bacterium]
MPLATDLLNSIRASENGTTLAELLTTHPDIARRTAQRWIAKMIDSGQITALGNGRARRYFRADTQAGNGAAMARTGSFPSSIPRSVDSQNLLAGIDQLPEAHMSAAFQRALLDAYRPNEVWYLPDSLRQQLHVIGRTTDADEPAGSFSHAILDRLLIDLSWASSHLEGNSYSRLEARELIAHGKVAREKTAVETQMILNHKTAIELLVRNINSAEFNCYTLMNLHGALAENLLPDPTDEGRIRQPSVDTDEGVHDPLSTPPQIEDTLNVLLDKASQIDDPFEQSFFMLVHLPCLKPFVGINRRTSRLAANLPLIRANLCPLTFLDVSEQAYRLATLDGYEMARVELLRDLYVQAYERSAHEYLAIRQQLVKPDPLRLTWRDFIRRTIREVITQPRLEPLSCIRIAVAERVSENEQAGVLALIVDEIRRLHDGVLARYGLRSSDYAAWKEIHWQHQPLQPCVPELPAEQIG